MRYFLYFLILLAISSCKKDNAVNYNGINCIDYNEDFKPINILNNDYDKYKLNFYNNSKLDFTETLDIVTNIIPGDKIVFHYHHYYQDTMPDNWSNQSIRFEIDNKIESFILSDHDLKKAYAIYGNVAFALAGQRHYHWISDGCIKGEKISNEEWQIDINITVTTESNYLYTEMISEIFKIAEK